MKEGLIMDAKNDAVQEQYRYSVFIAFLLIISVRISALNFLISVKGALVTLFNMQACFLI